MLENTTTPVIILKVIQCINLIMNSHSSDEKLSAAVFSEEDGYDFPHFRINYNIPMAVEVPFWPPTFYIFNCLTEAEIVFVTSAIRKISWYTPRAKFLFVGKGLSGSFLRYLAEEHILNGTFFDVNSRSLYAINLHRKGLFTEIDTRMDLIGFCRTDLKIINKNNLFQPTTPTHWTGATLRVLYQKNFVFAECFTCKQKYKGIESEILYMILKHLGFRILPNIYQNFEMFMKWHPNYKIGMVFGVMVVNVGETSYDITAPYFEERIAIFVPPQRLMARWKFILTVFNIETWLAWLVSVTLIAMTWLLSHYISNRIWILSRCFDMYVATYKLFLMQSYSSTTRRISQGMILLYIVILSTMMNYFFGTRLTYLLNGVNYESSIDSFEDLREKQLPIGVPNEYVRRLVKTELNDYPEYLYQNCSFDDLKLCIDRCAVKQDIALASVIRQIRHYETIEGKKGNKRLKQLKPTLFSAKLTVTFRKGHPVFPIVNRMLQYLVESGIVNKITEKYDTMLIGEEKAVGDPQRLSLKHIAAPSFILVFGLTFSFVVFIWENKHFTDA